MRKKVSKTHLGRIQSLFPRVKNVLDATESLIVEVKKFDQERSRIKDPMNCAMARACKREYGLSGVIIALSTAYLVKGDTATRYSVPASVSREVVNFDRNKNFEAGTYQLRVPAKKNRIGAYVGQGGHGHGPDRNNPKKRRFYHRTGNVRHFPDRAVVEEV